MKKFKKIAPAILITVITLGFSFSFVKNAEAAGIPFGGVIITFVPPIPYVCPVPHTLMFDYKTKTTFGLYVSGSTTIYPNFNIGTTGTFLLGDHGVVPALCLLPYKIFDYSRVGTS